MVKKELEHRVDGDTFEAIYTVLTSMANGICPFCLHIESPQLFYEDFGLSCPKCNSTISPEEQKAILEIHRSRLKRAADTFQKWRTS